MTTTIKINQATVEELEAHVDAASLEASANFGLADLIREGSSVTKQATGWGTGDTLCALSAATLAARARHLL